ncbi:MAG: hypothetical protein R2747_19880 [Pyrinomonadaceae bacterium]
MSSIKCPQCGLVNFSTAPECKRCKIALNELAPIAGQRNYQSPVRDFRDFQMPPPPPVFHGQNVSPGQQQRLNCITCGGTHQISIQTFQKDYVPPVVYLGIFLGLLPVLILILILRTRYRVEVPFCPVCSKNYRLANYLIPFSGIGFLCGLVLSMVAGIAADSLMIGLFLLALSSGLYVFIHRYSLRISPKIKKINGKQMIIKTPVIGDLCFDKK